MHVRMVCGSLLLTKSAGLSEASEGRGGLLFQPQAPRGTSIKRPPWQEDVVNILKPKNADLRFLPLLSKKGAAAADADRPAGADA